MRRQVLGTVLRTLADCQAAVCARRGHTGPILQLATVLMHPPCHQAASSPSHHLCWGTSQHSSFHTTHALQQAKQGGRSVKGSAKAATAASDTDDEASDEDLSLDSYHSLMQQAVSHYQNELGSIHGGRASPGLLEPIEVHLPDGGREPLKKLATVTARSAALLVVTPYRREDADSIAKAIKEGPLALGARVEGREVQVPFPRPTLEQIRGLVKLVSQEAEKSKHSVRSVRHKALEAVKAGVKAKDDRQRMEKQVQAITDKHIAEIDKLRTAKEKELEALR